MPKEENSTESYSGVLGVVATTAAVIGGVYAVASGIYYGGKALKALLDKDNDEDVKYLYHYTDMMGMTQILNSGFICKSTSQRGTDAVMGTGVYLTSLPPACGWQKILQNNYDGDLAFKLQRKMRTKFCFRFLKKDLPGVKRWSGDRNVWCYPQVINLLNTEYEIDTTDYVYDDQDTRMLMNTAASI